MARAALNFDGIQMEGARRRVDPLIRNEVDALDDAYYGTPQADDTRLADGWRSGVSKPYRIWDVQSTLVRSKLAFDILSGLLHHLTFLIQHLSNCDHRGVNPAADYDAYPELKYNAVTLAPVRGQPSVFVETKVRETKRNMRALIDQWNTANLSPPFTRTRWNNIVNFIRSRPVIAEMLSRRPVLAPVLDIDDETEVAP